MTYTFSCREGIDTIDAFVEHIKITAYGMQIRNRRISLPVGYRDGILTIGIDGRSHYGGYDFVAKPSLQDGAIVLSGRIEKNVIPDSYDSRGEKIFFSVMKALVTFLYCLPLFLSFVIRRIKRRRLLHTLLTGCGCVSLR